MRLEISSMQLRSRNDTPIAVGPGRIHKGLCRGRRGGENRKNDGIIQVMYANVTSFSPKAEHYLLNTRDHIWLAGESHCRGDRLDQVAERLARSGFNVAAAPATPSVDSTAGTYGGIIATSRKFLAIAPVAGDIDHERWRKSSERDLAGFTFNLKGSDILILGGYARGGDVLRLVTAVAKCTRNGRISFIWLADFNATPQEIIWLKYIDH